MCLRREVKCYKGMESEECCNNRVEDALRRRTYSFILIIAVALLILSVVITTVWNTDFVAQVSYASTITSIILSVIAIWMSITGERSTNEIKNKVSEAATSLTYTTNENVLSKVGITVGKGNKMELDEDKLKKADIGTLRILFIGHNSFASKVSMKATSISNAAAWSSGTYKNNGKYNNTLSELVSGKVDEEV